MTQLTPETPYERFKATYTPLYRILLILGGIAVLMSLASLTNLRAIFDYFSLDLMYALSGLISALIVPAFMISSLILLWYKHPVGIRLRLAGYGVSIVASITGLFTSPATLERLTKEVVEAAIRDGNGAITPQLAANITEASYYGALYISIGASLVFAWLWWKAWTKQVKVDAKKSAVSTAK